MRLKNKRIIAIRMAIAIITVLLASTLACASKPNFIEDEVERLIRYSQGKSDCFESLNGLLIRIGVS